MTERKKGAVVLDGGPRGGKGSVRNDAERRYGNVATDETGADYRAFTKGLIVEGIIKPEQPEAEVRQALARIGVSGFYDMATRRDEIMAEYGHGSLYEDDVQNTVSGVSPIAEVRQVIKAAFRERVQAVIDDDEHDLLVVDGRKLGPVIADMDIDTIMQVYMDVSVEEAARRDCLRKNIDPDVDHDAFLSAQFEIQKRRDNDGGRDLDKVEVGLEAIDYWQDPELIKQTLARLEEGYGRGGVRTLVDRRVMTDANSYTQIRRVGAGTLAVASGRQLFIDTTDYRGQHEDPRQAMLDDFDAILKEATDAASLPLVSR